MTTITKKIKVIKSSPNTRDLEDFYWYEFQCIQQHQTNYDIQCYHWYQIPEEILFQCGFITNYTELIQNRKTNYQTNKIYYHPMKDEFADKKTDL